MVMPNISLWYKKYERVLTIALALGLVGVIGWFGYKWYTKRLEAQAFADFSQATDDYFKAVLSTDDKQRWQDMANGLALQAQEHKSSVLAPYYLAYQADALVHDGKIDQALTLMNQVLAQLPKNSPFYYMYATKQALIKLDAQSQDVRAQGITELEQLAQDKENPVKDMALYHQGYHAWTTGNRPQAEKIWSTLCTYGDKDSVWVQLAQAKLEGIA